MAARPRLPKLVVLHVSPWSERARWALDHHGIEFETVQHAPFLGERRLRKLVGRRTGPATVPVLVHDGEVICESWDIVMHADRSGEGEPLVPAEHEAAIREWVRRVDEASSHGRALVVGAMLKSPAALDEGLPPPMPSWLRPVLRPITRYGTRWFGRKYDLRLEAVEEHEAAMRDALVRLREALEGGRYLLGRFTYADIVAASFVQGFSPVADEYLRLGPGTRAAWTRPALATEFADLVQWRDELYRDHRRPGA